MRGDLERIIDLAGVAELHIDRAYVKADLSIALAKSGTQVVTKPRPSAGKPGLFHKSAFKIDLRSKTATCPAGQAIQFVPGLAARFDPTICDACHLRARCTAASEGRGRSLTVPEDEAQQRGFRKLTSTKKGRALLRQRLAIEHTLAHHARAQGIRARYIGQRSNVFESRRAGALLNLEEASRAVAA